MSSNPVATMNMLGWVVSSALSGLVEFETWLRRESSRNVEMMQRPTLRTFVALLLGFTVSGCSIETGHEEEFRTREQRMTVDQTRVLGFESPTTDWSSNNGSTVSASTVASEGSGSLSVLPNGYTQISSIAIAAPGSAAATATFDLKVPQAVPWGEVRLIVKAPSQGH